MSSADAQHINPKTRRMPVAETDEEAFRERTKEELLASLEKSMEQALSGDHRPAREALDELKRKALRDG